MVLTASCGHKEIVCPADSVSTIDVKFVWDKAPGAEVDGMTLYFYPVSDWTRMWRFDIAGHEGGKVELPAGRYRLIAVNNDLPGIEFTGTDTFNGLTARARMADGTSATRPSGMLYGAVIDNLEVTLCGVEYTLEDGSCKECPKSLVRCYPDSMATVYTAVLRDIKGMDRVRSASARLDGVASSVTVRSGTTGDGTCTIPIQLSQTAEGGAELRGSSSGLGTPAGVPGFTLTIAVTRTDGKSFSKSFDVTDQVIHSPWTRNVHIYIDGLEIPEGTPPDPPDDDDVGIIVDVDGWHVIDIYPQPTTGHKKEKPTS